MKYKGLEINDDWDVYIGIEFECDADEIHKQVFKAIKGIKNTKGIIGVEQVLDGYLIVTSTKFDFTKDGVDCLKTVFKLFQDSDIDCLSLEVNVRADDFIFHQDDDDYNLDAVALDEFLESLEV